MPAGNLKQCCVTSWQMHAWHGCDEPISMSSAKELGIGFVRQQSTQIYGCDVLYSTPAQSELIRQKSAQIYSTPAPAELTRQKSAPVKVTRESPLKFPSIEAARKMHSHHVARAVVFHSLRSAAGLLHLRRSEATRAVVIYALQTASHSIRRRAVVRLQAAYHRFLAWGELKVLKQKNRAANAKTIVHAAVHSVVLRWMGSAALVIQRSVRGFLQRLDTSEAGRDLLISMRETQKKRHERAVEAFVASRRNFPEYRSMLRGLRDLVVKDSRASVLDNILKLEYEKQQLVGLEVVKDFLAGLQRDVIARTKFGEDIRIAPILLQGMPGSGKRLAATLIHKQLTTLQILKGQGEIMEMLHCDEDDLTKAFEAIKTGPVSNCIYISDALEGVDLHAVLKYFSRHLPKAVLIFGLNDKSKMQKISGFFTKVEAVTLNLPTLTILELAEIMKSKLEHHGYRFSGGLDVEMVVDAIADQWSTTEIRGRNAHLANIMVERVLHNKHQRKPVSFGFTTDPSVLVPKDFGVTELSKVEQAKMLEEVSQELEAMPGFQEPKRFIKDLQRRVEFVNAGGSPKLLETCMNVVLTGNPGTGKTTFARLMFRMLRALGILKKNVFVEKNALELKGGYLGHTAPNVRETVQSARGGCLFLDEAYALVGDTGHADEFSSEAIRTLLTEIENNRMEMLVIVAGYKEKMNQLLVQDPGLSRRFPLRINLPDYTAFDLSLIAKKVAMERFNCTLEEGLTEKLERHIAEEHRAEICTQNASLAVGLVEQAVQRMTCRLMAERDTSNADLGQHLELLTAVDFGILVTVEENNALERARVTEEVQGLIGMTELKAYLNRLQKRVEFVKNGGSPKVLETCMNVVLTGNPGTGKTTFARLMFRTLRAHGVLTKDVFIERNALELKGQYCGQTAPKIKELFQMALGGCLFLDEAYALANGDQFSNEAIRMLLTEVENHRTEVLVVLAGYDDKMKELLRADPGLARRFPTTLALQDYAPCELAEIASKVAEERFGVPLEDGLEIQLGKWIEKNSFQLNVSNHNGGLAVNLVEEALGRMAERVIEFGIDARAEDLRLAPSDFGLTTKDDDSCRTEV
eukprot:gnl/MRDRNA2_/MRDRNA2_76808_c0_seq1.p1 gnl/MRDRNA2_/MRDRNA2_76808_c0~~gnl/MRDRNA2_/MRDRNA2_76808_c0_seq1.p1  ORF type:complete len:1089 (+),score=233.23 gnl/MRDRNA2_/MRDRNA2_76808_c0_seq1:142-3408(+)